MSKRLEGKRALITGAGSGIGQGMARLFAEEGADIAVNDLDDDRIAETVAIVESLGRKAIGLKYDVTDFEQTQAATKEAAQFLGGVDILCSNAGIAPSVDFVDMTPAQWKLMLSVHLDGMYNGVKAVIPGMLAQKWGRVVVTASMSAVNGDMHLTHYSAAKAGQVGFVKALAREVVGEGVTVNAIAPGLVKTNILGEVDEEVIQKYGPPVGRIGQPSDQAYGALYLASDEAEFVTGQLLQINGGSF